MADTCGVADLKERAIILKMVQIPDSLFVALVKFHVLGIEDCLPEIKNGLEQKLDKTEAEREEARQAYLDKVGMHRDFRW